MCCSINLDLLTVLRPGSMRMIDDDKIGLKEKPQDNRYTINTESVGKLNIMDIIPNCMPLLGTADLGMDRFVTP